MSSTWEMGQSLGSGTPCDVLIETCSLLRASGEEPSHRPLTPPRAIRSECRADNNEV